MKTTEEYALELVWQGAESTAEDDTDEDGELESAEQLTEAIDLAIKIAHAVRDNPDVVLELVGRPRRWAVVTEPDEKVTAVTDTDGDRWTRCWEGWIHDGEDAKLPPRVPWAWHNLLAEYGPLTDATADQPVSTDG